MNRLENKVAIVFGGGPNMGGTIAHFMAREGAKIVVADIVESAAVEAVDFLRSRDYEGAAMQGDAAEEDDVIRMVTDTVKTYGKVDIIVNMAGKIHWSPITEMELEGWRTCLLSYPTAAMLTTKHAARAMIDGGISGSIIHIISTAAHFGEASGAAYTAAKAAVLNFARSAAMDLAHDRIRVNTITPCGMEHMLWTKTSEEISDPDFVPPKRRVNGGSIAYAPIDPDLNRVTVDIKSRQDGLGNCLPDIQTSTFFALEPFVLDFVPPFSIK